MPNTRMSDSLYSGNLRPPSSPKNAAARNLQDLLDPSIVKRGIVAPWGRDKQGAGQWAVPGIVAEAMKALDQTGQAMRLPHDTPANHPAYKGVSDVAGAINMPALLRKGATSTLGMNLWHGGPNKWAAEPGFPQGRPRLDKMGSGEGNQAYGHGFYSAQKPEVATSYKNRLSPISGKDINKALPQKYQGGSDNANKIVSDLLDKLDSGEIKKASEYLDIYEVRPDLREAYKIAIKQIDEGGNLYKIDIPDQDVAKYLDWDAPLSEQTDALAKIKQHWSDTIGDPDIIMDRLGISESSTGQELYQALGGIMQRQQAASEALGKAGIPGNKYRDQMSQYDPDILPDNMIANEARKWLGQSDGDSKKAIKLFKDSNPRALYAEKEINEIEKVISTANRKITRNYVTWDQKVLDRTKVLQRNEEIYKQLEKSGVPFA